jgi:NAD(P)-dependent dehydrogenase (short-subunit alcohol dehydrogenase family)
LRIRKAFPCSSLIEQRGSDIMGTLDGKVAVITGGSSGIGLATAKRFVDEGAFVFITGREQAALDEAKGFIGRNVMAIQGDAGNLADVERLYGVVRDVKGHVDIVFVSEATDLAADHYDGIFNSDVRGVLFPVDGALELMRDGGSIMIDGALAGTSLRTSSLREAQGAIRALARDWTFDLSDRRIRACITDGDQLGCNASHA